MVVGCLAETKTRTNEETNANTQKISQKQEDATLSLDESMLKVQVEKVEVPTINIKAVGDVMLGRGVGGRLNEDYISPFKEVAPFLNSADITFANLECSISDRGQALIGKGVWLRAQPKAIEGLLYAGFNIINIANNHILDYNEIAMFDTIDILDEHGIKHMGAGKNLEVARKPAILGVEGVTVGFVGYTDLYQYGYGVPGQRALKFVEAKENEAGVAPLKLDMIKEDVKSLRDKVDIVIVSLHWGIEDSQQVPQTQREFAYEVIDAGADMILGHHPHRLQGIEFYDGKPIVYSMGNFLFDQNDKENNESMIVDIDFTDGKVSRFEIIPCLIANKTQTVYATGEDAAHIVGYMQRFSQKLDTPSIIEGEKLIFYKQ